jgi:hypothetical protein
MPADLSLNGTVWSCALSLVQNKGRWRGKPIGSNEPMGVAWALMRLRNSLHAARAGASGLHGEFFLKARRRALTSSYAKAPEGTPRLTSFGWRATRSSKSEGWCG